MRFVSPLKYADYIDGTFVIVTALGLMTVDARLQRRISVDTTLIFAEQMLAAVAHAHDQGIIHCDIKPDNFLVFPENRVRLTDFGIARFAQHTLQGSGAGTVGYIAPEQAMGKPSFRSDVFSLGLVFYRMFTGYLPEWPFDWPPPGYLRLRKRIEPDLIDLIRKCLELNTRRRYRDAVEMQAAFHRIVHGPRRQKRKSGKTTSRGSAGTQWQQVRRQEFRQQFGRLLQTHLRCEHCQGPVAEAMRNCPWCGKTHQVKDHKTRFPAQCPRCRRGIKLDWHYCAWCYGAGLDPQTNRKFNDRRYTHRCDNPRCDRKQLMPFMRYCPWCRRRVRKKWTIDDIKDRCHRCGWGVLPGFWKCCPWCAAKLET
jgi:serine/threonine-protein kinase